MLVYVLFMSPINGTYRWIRLGMFSFQPSELAKIVLLLFIAAYLYKHIDKIRSSPAMIFPALLIIGIYTALIIVEPDLGTGIIIIFTVLIVVFLVTIPLRYYIVSAIGVSSIIYYLIISSN
jgi:cell division protein FtsW